MSLKKELPPLVYLGDPLLAKPAEDILPEELGTPKLKKELKVLQACMHAYDGIGIAAPQVGWRKNVFVMATEKDTVEFWLNPKIVSSSSQKNWGWEGCLSVPGWMGWIRRPSAVAVSGLDEKGRSKSKEFALWPARVFQHEFDHLLGYLYPYRSLDPKHLVSSQAFQQKASWSQDWPAPGAAQTPPGELWEKD